jgi:P-type Ca2+ transporter type 2C
MTVRELWGRDHRALLAAGCACCDAELGPDRRSGTGDPTEIAILAAGSERGIERPEIEATNPRVAVYPFDTERKRMSILRSNGVLYVKGAFDLLLPLCQEGTEGAASANADMAGRGLRVLAVAVGSGTQETNLRLLGLLGLAHWLCSGPGWRSRVRCRLSPGGRAVRLACAQGDAALLPPL